MQKYTGLSASLVCLALVMLMPATTIAADTGEAEIVQLPPLIFRTGYCGDGNCDEAESCDTCSADCGECEPAEIPLGMRALALVPLAILVLYIFTKKAKSKPVPGSLPNGRA